jgi:ribonuclease HII
LQIHNITISEIQALLRKQKKAPNELLAAMKKDSRIGVQRLLEKYDREQKSLQKLRDKAEQMLINERRLWDQGYLYLAGLDEAGRGPLAGPVVSACVILPKGLVIEGVDDSKKLTASKREDLFDQISKKAIAIGVGIIDHCRIDNVNILYATKEAMIQAVNACKQQPDYLLLDAIHLKDMPLPQLSIIGGDAKSQSIAAASIIAKVTRDRMMEGFARLYPEYGFDKHKGYGTAEHIEAIRKFGISPIHRKSFLIKIFSNVQR